MDLEIRLLLFLFIQFLLLCGRLTTRTLTFVHAEYCADSINFWLGLACELICFVMVIHSFGTSMQYMHYVQELQRLKKMKSKQMVKRRSHGRFRKRKNNNHYANQQQLRSYRSVPAIDRLSPPIPPRPVRFEQPIYDEVASSDSFDWSY